MKKNSINGVWIWTEDAGFFIASCFLFYFWAEINFIFILWGLQVLWYSGPHLSVEGPGEGAELVEDAAQGPDVGLAVVGPAQAQLGGQVAGGAHHSVRLALAGQTKNSLGLFKVKIFL